MATKSAWSWDRLEYDYYECPGDNSVGGWGNVEPNKPKKPPTDPIGKDIGDRLPRLPGGCRVVGRGKDARGQIVKPPSRPFSGFGDSGPVQGGWRVLGALGVGVAIVWGFKLIEQGLGRR